jgi:hypothetical protein
LVIDPVLRYSSYLGGNGTELGAVIPVDSIAVDSFNRAIVTGLTCSLDFPATIKSNTGCSTFVAKLDVTGSHLVFSTFIGQSVPTGIALDREDNIYIIGFTFSPDFAVTPGAFQTKFGGGFGDAFASKLSRDGTALLYSTFLGGSDSDGGSAIAVDQEGSAYLTGFTSSRNFPTTSGAFQSECKLGPSGTCGNAFVTKLDPTGSRAVYSTFLGGHGFSNGGGIAVDGEDNAFVTGGTDTSDFPTTAGTAQPTFGGGFRDAYVTKLSSSGSHLIFSTFLGGTGDDVGEGIGVDSIGNAYVTGQAFFR